MPGHGRLGLSICYDAWFPEVTRHLAWMGAEVVLNLVKTTTADRAQELVLARANAIVNQVFVVSVNCAGPVGTGQSLIVDPEGARARGGIRARTRRCSPTCSTSTTSCGHAPTARPGLNRMWDHFQDGDAPLELPLYQGRIDPKLWHIQSDDHR